MMIFSLLWLTGSPGKIYAQQDKSQMEVYEQQVLNNLNSNNSYGLNGSNGNSIEMSQKRTRSEQTRKEKKAVTKRQSRNYIQLQINGDQNQVTAEQNNGDGNYMNLGVKGNGNKADYTQTGSNNDLFDRVSGNNLDRQVEQTGNQLGIYNIAGQSLPMKIQQRGKNMQIIIR